MKRLINTLLRSLILFIGLSITHEAKSIDTQVIPYYIRFVDIADQCLVKLNDVHLRIELSDKLENDKWIAVCEYSDDLIKVRRNVWDRLKPDQREQVIFHEAAHCLLNLRHDESEPNIMNAGGFLSKDFYTNNYDYLIRKLFKNCRSPLYKKFQYEEVK